jgi:hypothetical protein
MVGSTAIYVNIGSLMDRQSVEICTELVCLTSDKQRGDFDGQTIR